MSRSARKKKILKKNAKVRSARNFEPAFNKKSANSLFISSVGDLNQGRLSFFRFLTDGLKEELAQIDNPIVLESAKNNELPYERIYFNPNNIKINLPSQNSYSTADEDKTYSAQVFVLTEYWHTLSYNQEVLDSFKLLNSHLQLQQDPLPKNSLEDEFVCEKHYLCIAEIPFITEEGSFIINGCERVVVNQIIRSPGIYFKKEHVKRDAKEKLVYTAIVISDTGHWTKISLDAVSKNLSDHPSLYNEKDSPYMERPYIENEENLAEWESEEFVPDSENDFLYIYDAFPWFGLTELEIRDSLKYPRHYDEYIKEIKSQNLLDSRVSLDEELESLYHPSGLKTFSIGKAGRYRVNKRLDLNLPDSAVFLTVHDLIAITNVLLDFRYLASTQLEDDIDHIKNKQIRSVGELLQLHFKTGLIRMLAKARKLLGLYPEMNEDFLYPEEDEDLFSSEAEENEAAYKHFTINDYFDSDKNIEDLSDIFIDDQNQNANSYARLASAFNPQIISSEIKRFFTTSEISQFFDQTNALSGITHKRRISVFGPNGLQRDHVSTAVRDIHPSQYGRICPVETSEGHNAGLVTSIALLGQIASLGWIEAPYFYAENGHIFSREMPVFISPQAESKLTVSFDSIALQKNQTILTEYSSAKEDYLFATVKSKAVNFLSVSPFQILSAATTLIPFLEHNDANRVLMGSNMQRQAVPLLFAQKPIVGTGLEAAIAFHSSMVVKSFCSGFVLGVNAAEIIVQDVASSQKIYYPLQKNYCSNQETSINQKPAVWPGEWVFFNQIISDGPSIVDAELSLGRNLLVAYMPWEGYNYEDAIVINQRLLDEDCLTSIHIGEYETFLNSSVDELYSEILTADVPEASAWLCRHLDSRSGIAKVGSYVREYDILVGKKVAEEADSSTQMAIFLDALQTGEKTQMFFKKRDTSEDIFSSNDMVPWVKKDTDKKKRKTSKIQTSNIEYDENDETIIAYIYRNVSLCAPRGTHGTVIETRLINLSTLPADDSNLENYRYGELVRVFIATARKAQLGDKLAGRHGNKGIISKILSSRDMPHLPDGTPIDILLNPLGVPSRMNVGQVFEGLLGLAGEKIGCRFKVSPFDEAYGEEASRTLVNKKLKEAARNTTLEWLFNPSHLGKIFLKDGRTGEYFDNPITVGKSYILKLIHMVEDKIHARATGPYTVLTEQPLAGKANFGGQRFGEMEVWALEAFGCSNILQELLTIKADDIDGRNDMYLSLSSVKNVSKPSPNISETYLVLIRELNALGLEFSLKKIEHSFSAEMQISQHDVNLFEEVEKRLKLREILEKKFEFNSP